MLKCKIMGNAGMKLNIVAFFNHPTPLWLLKNFTVMVIYFRFEFDK